MLESPTKEREVETPPFGAPHVFVLAQVSGNDNTGAFRLNTRETVEIGNTDAEGRLVDFRADRRRDTGGASALTPWSCVLTTVATTGRSSRACPPTRG